MLENSEYHSELKMGHGTSKIIIQHEMIIKIYSNTSCFFFLNLAVTPLLVCLFLRQKNCSIEVQDMTLS